MLSLNSRVKAHLHIPFMHAFTTLHCIFYNLPWFVDVYEKKVISSKTQRNAENACRNRMWQLGFAYVLYVKRNKKEKHEREKSNYL